MWLKKSILSTNETDISELLRKGIILIYVGALLPGAEDYANCTSAQG